MVIHGFHVSVSFVNISFHDSVNVFDGVDKFRYFYIMFYRRGRRYINNFFQWGMLVRIVCLWMGTF